MLEAVNDPVDAEVIATFRQFSGTPVTVELKNGERYRVLNIAWGYDCGEEHAHVTTNISPPVDGESIDVFSTSDVVAVLSANGQAIRFDRDDR